MVVHYKNTVSLLHAVVDLQNPVGDLLNFFQDSEFVPEQVFGPSGDRLVRRKK